MHTSIPEGTASGNLRSISSGSYVYNITPDDLKTEQEAFEAAEGVSYVHLYTIMLSYLLFYIMHTSMYTVSITMQKKELVPGYGVYIKFTDLAQAEQNTKSTSTGLMRSLISLFYSRE